MQIKYIAVLLALVTSAAAAQTPCVAPDARAVFLTETLVDEGFEAVGTCIDGSKAVVTYENRLYRDDIRAVEAIVQSVTTHLADIQSVQLVPTRTGIRLATIDLSVSEMGTAIDPSTTSAELAISSPLPDTQNSPSLKLDAVLHPVIRAQFGDFDTPIRADIELNPTLETALWPGATAMAQLVLPILSDVQGSDGSVRAGIVALHQRVRLPGATFARVSAGRFTRNRYGVDLGATSYLAEGRLVVHARLGRTGFSDFDGTRALYSALNTTTYSAGIEAVVLPTYALTIGANVERYLSEKTGVRGEIARQFGETRIGFFGTWTESERSEDRLNVGGRITFALPMARHARPGRVRARLANRMEIEYQYRRLTEGRPSYEVVPVPTDMLGPLNPALLNAHLQRRVE